MELHAPNHRLLAPYAFEPRTATGIEFFSYLTFFTLPPLSIFSLVETISLKIWKRPQSWHANCSLPISVRDSKTLRALSSPFPSHRHLFCLGFLSNPGEVQERPPQNLTRRPRCILQILLKPFLRANGNSYRHRRRHHYCH